MLSKSKSKMQPLERYILGVGYVLDQKFRMRVKGETEHFKLDHTI